MSTFSQKQVVKNFVSLCIGQYGGLACNIAFSILLTRLLSPDDYGLVAISLFYFNFFNWLLEWGWEQGFMAHKEIPLTVAAPTHFTIRSLLGLVPLLSFLCCYPVLIRLFSSRACSVMCLLAIIYWIERMGLTFKTILEQRYRLHELATLEFLATCISYVCAVGAAVYGWGVYALVVQRGIERGAMTIGYVIASPWKGGGSFSTDCMRKFLSTFGLASWLGSIVGIAIYDGMPFIIRLFSDTYQAGLYAKAFSLATFPVMLTGIFSRLTTPLYRAHQLDVAHCRRVFVRAQSIKLYLLVPGQLMMGIGAPWWIPLLLGNQWLPLVPIYQVMTIYGLFRAFFDDVPNVLAYGFKNPWALTKNQTLQAAILLLVGVPLVYGLQALGGALAMSVMMISATILFWHIVCKQLTCNARNFLVVLRMLPILIIARVWGWKKRF